MIYNSNFLVVSDSKHEVRDLLNVNHVYQVVSSNCVWDEDKGIVGDLHYDINLIIVVYSNMNSIILDYNKDIIFDGNGEIWDL